VGEREGLPAAGWRAYQRAAGPRRSRVCVSTTPTARRSDGLMVEKPRTGRRCLWYARKRATSGLTPRGITTCVGTSGRW